MCEHFHYRKPRIFLCFLVSLLVDGDTCLQDVPDDFVIQRPVCANNATEEPAEEDETVEEARTAAWEIHKQSYDRRRRRRRRPSPR